MVMWLPRESTTLNLSVYAPAAALDTLLISQVRAQTGILIQTERDLVSLGVADNGYGTLPSASRASFSRSWDAPLNSRCGR